LARRADRVETLNYQDIPGYGDKLNVFEKIDLPGFDDAHYDTGYL
jgi:hypothetical protein